MHSEKASAFSALPDWGFLDPPAFDETTEGVDDGLLCVVVEPTCATGIADEPPHAAANRARVAVAMMAAKDPLGRQLRGRFMPVVLCAGR
jgi:hypothetical protein